MIPYMLYFINRRKYCSVTICLQKHVINHLKSVYNYGIMTILNHSHGAAMASTGVRKFDKRVVVEAATLKGLNLNINANDTELAYAA